MWSGRPSRAWRAGFLGARNVAETDAVAKLYWTGNAAKARIIARILEDKRPGLTVLDYGAGRGGDWPTIMQNHRRLKLVCYEPDESAASMLRSALSGLPARVLTAAEFETTQLQADYIVSFSVLEHVLDRRAYLANAKRLLVPDGAFHLNYDDGHFRTALDLDEAREWKLNVTETIRNRVSGLWPHIGRQHLYQSRVRRLDIVRMISAAGLVIAEERYDNLKSLKQLSKTIPPDRMQEFARWWIEAEDRLNQRFRAQTEERMGDDVNLWREMGSRTLVLRHA